MKNILLAIVVGILGTEYGSGASPFDVKTDVATRDGDTILNVAFTVPAKHHLYAEQIRVEPVSSNLVVEALQIPEAKVTKDPFSGENVRVYERDVNMSFRIRSQGSNATVRISFQGCDETQCFFPETREVELWPAGKPQPHSPEASARTEAGLPEEVRPWKVSVERFVVTGRTGGYLEREAFLKFIDESLAAGSVKEDALRESLKLRGLWITLLLILAGGLALNLTPCVLPMIPVNLAIIGASSESGKRLKGFTLGMAYGLGIALVYGGLGLIVLLTGATFGTVNSSAWFNIGIAVLFAVLALGMFDIISIDLSRFQGNAGGPGGRKGTLVTAFVLGGVAALLAGACVAPVVISVLVLAADLYSRGQTAGLLLPFVLGLGMALPWPFAGAGMSFLPRPGAWMVRVKILFGIIILVVAAKYGYTGARILMARTATAETGGAHEGWETSLDRALVTAEAKGLPVFVDMWATWCTNCKRMDATTFKEPAVIEALGRMVKVKVQAERPSDPATAELMKYFGAEGLPTYVVMKPRPGER